MVTIIGRFLCYALARQRPGLPCVKGAVSEADWGIALPQHRYTHKLHRNFCRHRCWEYGWLSDHIPPEKRCGLHLFWCFYPHSVENRPTQWQALLLRNRSQRYIFPTPFVWKNGQGRTAENHTIGAVLPCHFFSQLFCQRNQLLIVLWLHDNPSVTAYAVPPPFTQGRLWCCAKLQTVQYTERCIEVRSLSVQQIVICRVTSLYI